jgi:drug/metabolite transporter (DMT)-like permease
MQAQIRRSMSLFEWALLLALSILWGGSFFFNAIALAELTPLTIVAIRVTIGAALLYVTLKVSGGWMPRGRVAWRAFAVMGVLNNIVPFILLAWGQSHVASGLASILNATTPLFTVVAAHFFTQDEKLTSMRIAGVAVGFAGAVIMIGADALTEAGDHLVAEIAVLGAAACYAASAIYARRFARMGIPPLATATGQIVVASASMIVLALAFDHPWRLPAPGLPTIAALVGIGGLSTYLAYIIYYRILASAGAVNVMLVTFLIPVTAVILGAAVLGERLSANHFLGMALIGLGLAAIDGRMFRLVRRRAQA